MKKMILILTVVTTFIACRSNTEKTAAEQTKETAPPVQPVVVQKEVHYVTPKTQAPVEQKKKGWSKAAKGAAIGGAAGAVTGAVVSKNNRVKGAVIGGVIGAGTGYVIGRNKDKKDGRVKK